MKDEKLEFELRYKGVEVGIIGYGDGVFCFNYTNYGSQKERVEAIDHFHRFFNFDNWK